MAEETLNKTQAPALSAAVAPQQASTPVSVSTPTQTPDAIQPFIDKAYETVLHEVEGTELGAFLRAHIKAFREEWETWSDSAKDAYIHMMASQLLQRKAAATQIGLGHEFKLPAPSAQTHLMDALRRSQVKPAKRYPAIDMPRQLRGVTS